MNSNLRIETLAIGDELLTGKIADSNSAFVGGSLFSEGLRLVRQNVVLDKKEDILAAMSELAHRAQVVVCFGGLGPTSDDITAATIADFLGTKLIQDKSSHERLLVYLKARGRSVTEQTLKQVLIPEQTSPIPNPVGSAPGFQFEHQGCLFFFLPGVPDEMRSMFNESVLPQIIKKTARQGRVVSKVWRCIGVVESELQRLMVSVEAGLPQGMWLGYRTRFPENYLYLYSKTDSSDEQKKLLDVWSEKIQTLVSACCYGTQDKDLENWVFEKLKKYGKKIVTAESCTGGLVVHRLTQVAGASDCVWGGWVTYQLQAKSQLLNVEAQSSEDAVSEKCSESLAKSALKESSCDLALGITGYMGPSGGTTSEPVGTVFISVVDTTGKVLNEKIQLPPRPRATLQWGAASFALYAILKFLK